MRIALFSDIHANLPALEAFLKDVESQNVDTIYCLGDLVGYNIWPNEIIEEIRKRKIATIAGNHDEAIGNMVNTQKEIDVTILNNGAISKEFTNQLLTEENRLFLQTLPAHIRLEFNFNNEKTTILLVHGSPNAINEYIYEERPKNEILEMMQIYNADILCFGHTHKPFHKVLNVEINGITNYKHAINIGSVGKPKDNNTKGCYVILELNKNTSMLNKKSLDVAFIRFDYDIEKAAMAVENSILPNVFADNLRNGY
ncbi:metallophosphoesterase [Lutibacter sp. HS1-25]|uniref:metallophosphoesterase family protein n=1 Tax=Lutibacter sp. HS1-25 TaxID=2485000 RepID=UPI001010E372|nr:metallophosphoesterase family protein [Lutibacter sp. HS1-25]RXP61363.1 metallophosphoesterase [Lutibacter sp. HS1-25]